MTILCNSRDTATRLGKLSYVTLWTVKFDEIKKLYRDILSLPVVQENENFIMFETSGSRLAFHRLKNAPPIGRETIELHLEASDVDQVYSALRSKGVKFDEPPMNRPWGSRSAGFRDPEGYTVEIVGPLKHGEPTKGE